MYKKPTNNIILNDENIEAFPLLFRIVLEVLANAIRQEKERKVIHIWKEDTKDTKMCVFTDGVIIYVENLKELKKNLWNR